MKTTRIFLMLLMLWAGAGVGRSETNTPVLEGDPGERHFELLTVGALSFTNVWVARQTNFHILIRHDGGIYTIKLTDLPQKELAELKSQVGDLASTDASSDKPHVDSWLERAKSLIKNATPKTKMIGGAAVILVIVLLFVVLLRRKDTAPAV